MTILTIGVFDGVHRGHQILLGHLGEQSIAVTFSNHPSEILKGVSPLRLSSLRLKIALLKEFGVKKVIAIPFTEELSNLTFDAFLEPYPIRHLILGEGAAFGKEGLGNADALRTLGLRRGFTVQTIQKLCLADQPISSSRIRTLILDGKLTEAESLLGRPYCFEYDPLIPDLNIALPPDGSYNVWSHSPSGIDETSLTIQNRIPRLSANMILETRMMQLISFGPNLNPNLINYLCQTSPAVS